MFTRERIEKAVEIAVTHGYKSTQDPNQKRKDLFDEASATHRVYLVVILHNIPPEPSEIPRPILVTHPIFPLASTLSGVVEEKDVELVKTNAIFNKLTTIEEIRDVHLTFQMRRDLVKAYDVYACNTNLYNQVLKYGENRLLASIPLCALTHRWRQSLRRRSCAPRSFVTRGK